jgi:cellulose biosynthesis protein BcsQ
MSKLSLIIADNNSSFTDIFVNYLTSQHSQRFQVYCYSDRENLKKFFSKSIKEIDILLISPELYYTELENEKIKSIIILSNGRLHKDIETMKTINRFQSGDIVVSKMLNIFSEKNSDLIEIQPGSNTTKIVGVFSPVGGSGKTCISIASAITCADMGRNVFYLNLESIPSTQKFFGCEHEANLSHIFYHLKSKKINMGFKIEAIKNIDPIHSINYFSTQENLLEFNEVLPEEFETLIFQLRDSKLYDVIFVDLTSSVDYRNFRILNACDDILLVLMQDPISSSKADIFFKELHLVEENSDIEFSSKLTLILNKYIKEAPSAIENTNFNEKMITFKIPVVSQLLSENSGISRINLNNSFGDEISHIMQKIIN